MNDLILYLYYIDVFGELDSALLWLIVIVTIILGFVLIIILVTFEDNDERITKLTTKTSFGLLAVLTVALIIKVITPSTQTMYIALGLHTANQVLQQPQMVQVGNQAMRILQMKLDEYEKELTQENKGEVKND